MLSDRTKVVRGVMAFLGFCAVLGLFMGLRGAMPGNVDPEESAPLSTPSGVIVEAAPVQENLLLPAQEMALNEEAKEEAEEKEEATAPTPAAAATPEPEPAAAPKEEAPPADPVGEIIAPPAPPPPGDLY